jgi:hypothetical protein
MQSNMVYSVDCKDREQIQMRKTDRQSIRRMKARGVLSSTFEQQATADRDTNEDKLGRSSRIHSKKVDSLKLPNNNDNTDDKKVVLSALSMHGNDTGHRINWKEFRVVWRDENPYRLRIKESLLIQAYKLELNRTTHSLALIMFFDV